MNPKMASWLGLARRAGKLVVGDENSMKAIRSGKAKFVVLAEDASSGTIKKYKDKCAYYQVKLLIEGNSQDIGAAIGKPRQVVLAVVDQGFADQLASLAEINGGAIY